MTGELHHCSRVLYSEILSVLQFTSFTVVLLTITCQEQNTTGEIF